MHMTEALLKEEQDELKLQRRRQMMAGAVLLVMAVLGGGIAAAVIFTRREFMGCNAGIDMWDCVCVCKCTCIVHKDPCSTQECISANSKLSVRLDFPDAHVYAICSQKSARVNKQKPSCV